MKPKLEFRVFNKETNEMLYQQGEVDCYDDAIFFPFPHFDYIDGIKDLIIMQKYEPSLGIEVFEDDLVTAICSFYNKKEKRRICKIQRVNRGMSIAIYHNGNWYAYNSMDFTSIEVIGNLHENPELLSNH